MVQRDRSHDVELDVGRDDLLYLSNIEIWNAVHMPVKLTMN